MKMNKDSNNIDISLAGLWAECIVNKFKHLKHAISGQLLEDLRPRELVTTLIAITHRISEEVKGDSK